MRDQLPRFNSELKTRRHFQPPALQRFDLRRLVERMLNLNTREGAPIRLFSQTKSARADLQALGCILASNIWN